MPMYVNLPADADDGFPQAFLLAMNAVTYRFEFHVNIAEEQLRAAQPITAHTLVDVLGGGSAAESAPTGILVMAVTRQAASGDVPLLRRRVLPGLVYDAGDLLLTFSTVAVAAGNLNGAGSFGSLLTAGVATP
jgi:hypothetical protein